MLELNAFMLTINPQVINPQERSRDSINAGKIHTCPGSVLVSTVVWETREFSSPVAKRAERGCEASVCCTGSRAA